MARREEDPLLYERGSTEVELHLLIIVSTDCLDLQQGADVRPLSKLGLALANLHMISYRISCKIKLYLCFLLIDAVAGLQ